MSRRRWSRSSRDYSTTSSTAEIAQTQALGLPQSTFGDMWFQHDRITAWLHSRRDTLALPPAFEGTEQVGWLLGETILMLKAGWYAPPTDAPNPRITIATERARDTESQLRARGVTISDQVQTFDEFDVGSFLDSEGNKLWFCSPVAA